MKKTILKLFMPLLISAFVFSLSVFADEDERLDSIENILEEALVKIEQAQKTLDAIRKAKESVRESREQERVDERLRESTTSSY